MDYSAIPLLGSFKYKQSVRPVPIRAGEGVSIFRALKIVADFTRKHATKMQRIRLEKFHLQFSAILNLNEKIRQIIQLQPIWFHLWLFIFDRQFQKYFVQYRQSWHELDALDMNTVQFYAMKVEKMIRTMKDLRDTAFAKAH